MLIKFSGFLTTVIPLFFFLAFYDIIKFPFLLLRQNFSKIPFSSQFTNGRSLGSKRKSNICYA